MPYRKAKIIGLSFCSLLLFSVSLHAIENKEKLLYDFLDFATSSQSITDIENKIEQYEKDYQNDLYIYTQVMITKMEIFSEYMKRRDIMAKLSALNTKWLDYAKTQQLNSAEYTIWAKLKNTWLRYLSFKLLIKESRLAQQYYKKAIQMDKSNAGAYIGLGIWSLYAPKIAGGGLNQSVKLLKKGIAASRHDYDSYNGNLWLSQVYLKLGQKKEYREAWQQAEAVFGQTTFLQVVSKLNQQDKIIGE